MVFVRRLVRTAVKTAVKAGITLHVIDKADKQLYDTRLATCKQCPTLNTQGKCDKSKGGCGCFVASKALILNQKCPQGKW